MLESSGFRKYSTLVVNQLFSRRLCLRHCLFIRLCLCICVPSSFLNSYYHKLSENVWVWGSRGSRSGDLVRCYHSGTDGQTNKQKGKIELLSQWTMEGWDEQWQQSLQRKTIWNGISVWQGSTWRMPLLFDFLDPFLLDRTSNFKYVPSNVFTKRRHSFCDKTVSMSSLDLDKWPLHCCS